MAVTPPEPTQRLTLPLTWFSPLLSPRGIEFTGSSHWGPVIENRLLLPPLTLLIGLLRYQEASPERLPPGGFRFPGQIAFLLLSTASPQLLIQAKARPMQPAGSRKQHSGKEVSSGSKSRFLQSHPHLLFFSSSWPADDKSRLIRKDPDAGKD